MARKVAANRPVKAGERPHLERVARTSADFLDEQIAKLRETFPEAVVEGKVDWERLRATLGEIVDERPERYSFTWAGKQDSIRLLQTPSRATLVPCPEESVNWDTTQHLFIEGDNLEVLKLLYKAYFGRVKMIYIDPPYNTGNDFVYPDNYTDPLDTYLQLTGQKDAEGNLLTSNPQTSGRYHSRWLSMMYPRLFLARQLLCEDGIMFVSIDDNEVANLRLLMSEVFGEECFKNCIIFRRGVKSVQAQFQTVDALGVGHEYVLMYAKTREARFPKLQIELDEPREGSWNNHWRGTDRPTMRYELLGIKPETGQWRWSKERSLRAIENYQRMLHDLGVSEDEVTQGDIDRWYAEEVASSGEEIDLLRLSRKGKPEHYVPPSESKLGSDLWTDLSPRGSAELVELMGACLVDNPKPVGLIARMLTFATRSTEGDLVLDFFAGSCTTAQAVIEANREDGGNRRFIMVQLPEQLDWPAELDNGTVVRTIADVGKERIRRAIQRLHKANNGQQSMRNRDEPEDLGFRVFRLTKSSFRQWVPLEGEEPEGYAEQMGMFEDPLVDNWTPEHVIYEVALKEGLGLNCRIGRLERIAENAVWQVSDPDKGQTLRICLDERLDPEAIGTLNLGRDDLFICRDAALDDTLAANLALQCRLKVI